MGSTPSIDEVAATTDWDRFGKALQNFLALPPHRGGYPKAASTPTTLSPISATA